MCCEIMNEITRDTRLLRGILARDVHVSKDGRTIKHLQWIQTNYEMRTTCFYCKHLQNVLAKILFTPSKIHDYSIDNLLTLSSSFAKRVTLRLSTSAHLKPGLIYWLPGPRSCCWEGVWFPSRQSSLHGSRPRLRGQKDPLHCQYARNCPYFLR